jgi:formiminotetrahydrofolate cyclodeaminase
MLHYHYNYWEDLFFPRRHSNLKRVVVLSAATSVLSVAIANFFSKKVNRENIKKSLNKIVEESRMAKARISDNAHEAADDFNYRVREKTKM